ncbi:hypothetical protein [Streptomyces sp. NPDC015680]|uniref:hypothetical protein n=1 Tax=Streptomyces sp. NPDC015680 TaxID=3364962 RepID=UPI0036F89DE8
MSTTAEEVRGATRGDGAAITALISGSMVLAGRICRCAGGVLVWAWDLASTDSEATAAAQAKADKAARVKAAKAKAKADQESDDDQDEEEGEATAPPVAPVRRPVPESAGMLALGGMLAAGAAGTVAALITPYLGLLAPWRPVIVSVGGLAWMVAAWMVAPPPTAKDSAKGEEDSAEEAEDSAEGAETEEAEEEAVDGGEELLRHVLRSLAAAESAGRAGLHLDVVLDSAAEAGLVPEGTEVSELRAWVGACGIPTDDKVGMRIGGKPVTRVGMRIARVTEALGMSPAALLRARSAAPAGGPAGTPARPVGETPAETTPEAPVGAPAETPDQTPAGVPVPAALRLIPGGRRAPSQTPSPTLSQEGA